MTLADTPRRAGPFIGNGVATEFPFYFRVIDDEDLLVTRTPTDDLGAPVTLALGADYTVYREPGLTDNEARGAIILPEPLPVGFQLDVIGNAAYDQRLLITNQGRYNAEDVMNALDRGVVLAQQLRETLTRALVIPPQFNVTDFGALVQDITTLAGVAQEIAALGGIVAELTALGEIVGDLANSGSLVQQAVDAANAAAVAAAEAAAAAAAVQATAAAFNSKFTVSTELPSGGAEGDIWFRITP